MISCRRIIVFALLCCFSQKANAEEWCITTAGYGPAHIGMSVEEVSTALNTTLTPDEQFTSEECYNVVSKPDIPGLSIMVSKGVVVRFSVYEGEIKTRSGFGIGASEAEIIQHFGREIEIDPHKYVAPDGNYLTLWSSNQQNAVRFETFKGKVTALYTGRKPEVLYVEDCL